MGMHYYAALLFSEVPDEEDIALAMEPFDENLAPIDYEFPMGIDDVELLVSEDPENFSAFVAPAKSCDDVEVGWSARTGPYEMRFGNPEGYWDWYEIGGRWDRGEDGGDLIARNSLFVSELLEQKIIPASVVVGGQWHGEGSYENMPVNRMGVWDFSAVEKRNRQEVVRVLEANKDMIAVGVDYHR